MGNLITQIFFLYQIKNKQYIQQDEKEQFHSKDHLAIKKQVQEMDLQMN